MALEEGRDRTPQRNRLETESASRAAANDLSFWPQEVTKELRALWLSGLPAKRRLRPATEKSFDFRTGMSVFEGG